MEPASQREQPRSGQRLGPGIPMYLLQSSRTGTEHMLTHSCQYFILSRSYQKTKTKCMFYQSENNRVIFLVLYKP